MNNPSIAIPKILRIIRIHIVLGGAVAFSIGVLLAIIEGGTFELEIVAIAYASVFFGDLSAHFSNDYYDVEIDKHAEKKKYFEGSRILVKNPSLRAIAHKISIALLFASIVLAAGGVIFLGAPIELLIIMLGANIVGWFYSAPPLRLISRGLGEIVVACVTGFVIPGVGYLAVRNQFDSIFFYLSIPFMMYGFVLSLSLHLPDAEIDQKSNKKTLTVRKHKNTIVKLILIVSTLASLILFGYFLLITSVSLNLGMILILSIATLTIICIGFVKFRKESQVASFAALNIASLFLFNVLLIVYLILAASSIA